MRTSFSFIVITFSLLLSAPHVNAQTSGSKTFTTNLSLGSSGASVVTLQQILNRDPDTRIAVSGPGSAGNETRYFGTLTRLAVMRFQEKYANEVLTPAGLTRASGYVGYYTRTKLDALALSKNSATTNVPPAPSATTSTPTTNSPVSSSSASASQNPNLKNLDRFLAVLDATAAKQKLSSTTLAIITAQVMKDVATTTNLRSAFLKQIPTTTPHQSLNDTSFAGRILAKVEEAFTSVFLPEHALAATGVPFGGALIYPFYCTQSETWLITISPLPPSYAVLLTYVPFSQAFLSYNIPATNWLLGQYEPGAGVCVAGICPYCVTIPSEGMISPMVGSSPA
ncbi:MAG: peptidoglycan-binding domain-containing protein [Minisyncoccota bacterium]